MLYKELDTDQIVLPQNSKLNIEVKTPIILVPLSNQRVFLNWFNEKGSLQATHTVTKSIRISKDFSLVNPNPSEIRLLKIIETS